MALKNYQLDLALGELSVNVLKLQNEMKIEVEQLSEITEDVHELLTRLHDRCQVNKNLHELPYFLDQILGTIRILKFMADSDEKPKVSPNSLYDNMVSAFDRFLVKIGQEKHWKKIKKSLIKALPDDTLQDVLYCCEAVPKYWRDMGKGQKFALILSAGILLTAAALTIAVYASPEIAGIAAIGLSMLVLAKLGTMLFRCVINGPMMANHDRKERDKISKKLDNFEASVTSLSDQISPHKNIKKSLNFTAKDNKSEDNDRLKILGIRPPGSKPSKYEI